MIDICTLTSAQVNASLFPVLIGQAWVFAPLPLPASHWSVIELKVMVLVFRSSSSIVL